MTASHGLCPAIYNHFIIFDSLMPCKKKGLFSIKTGS
jgi:hypothetical protein